MNFLRLLEEVDPIKLCPECMVIKTPRSFHCSTCNQCIERYDHHCVWLNNCIGIKNHFLFMIFIVVLSLNITCLLVTTIYYYVKLPRYLEIADLKYIIFRDKMEMILTDHLVVSVIYWVVLCIVAFFFAPINLMLLV
jgi:hypothetical protein